MTPQRLETERLLLRPPRAADIGAVVILLGDFDVAKNLSRAPHPYTEDDGCAWIVRTRAEWLCGGDYSFSILRKVDGAVIGGCGIHRSRNLEIGYWLGKAYWGYGFATEAVSMLVAFAFDEMDVESLQAGWFTDNPASGRVLAKLGCVTNGTEDRICLSRGCRVICHKVVLTRAAFECRNKHR